MTASTPRIHTDNPSALPVGTRLGEFELLSLLGVGGFGIVYLAFDHALEREVAVKEYMPASLAGRTETMHVSLRSQSDADTFALGLKSFVNEAKLLARFDHPSLLKVLRFWEANGTAYMAMPVMRGQTLKEMRAGMTQAPTEHWLREMLGPLLGAIEKLHSEGVYHRDIAPDNIQIEPDGHPVLLDFGAARRVISDKSQTLTAILKPAYAPIEQYAEAGSVKQGPWTDLYALGATLHYLLLNRPPPPATTRAVHDEASALTIHACQGCGEDFLRTIDWMLAPRPADRPQSVAALREVLDGHAAPPLRRVDHAPQPSQWDRTVISGSKVVAPTAATTDFDFGGADDKTQVVPAPSALRTDFDLPLAASAAVAGATAPAAAAVAAAPFELSAPPVSTALGAAPASAAPGRKWLPMAVGAGLLATAVAAVALWPRGAAVPAAETAASAALAGAAAPSMAAASAPAAESTVKTVVLPATPPSVSPDRNTGKVAAPASSLTAAPPAPPAPPAADKPAARPAPVATGSTPVPSVSTAPAQAPAATPRVSSPPSPAGQSQGEASAGGSSAGPAATTTAPQQATPAQTSAADAAKAAAVKGPEARCGGRNPLSYFVCMERECLRSEFSAHADCLKWRQEARREPN